MNVKSSPNPETSAERMCRRCTHQFGSMIAKMAADLAMNDRGRMMTNDDVATAVRHYFCDKGGMVPDEIESILQEYEQAN